MRTVESAHSACADAIVAAMVQPGCDVGQVAFEMAGLVVQVGAVMTPSPR